MNDAEQVMGDNNAFRGNLLIIEVFAKILKESLSDNIFYY